MVTKLKLLTMINNDKLLIMVTTSKFNLLLSKFESLFEMQLESFFYYFDGTKKLEGYYYINLLYNDVRIK